MSVDQAAYEWAVKECGGIEAVRRGMEFDAFPPWTVLDGADGWEVACRLDPSGEWETQHNGSGPYSDDVRGFYICGDLVKRPPAIATLHTSAADLPAAPPSQRRIDRLRSVIDNDPIWKDGYEEREEAP